MFYFFTFAKKGSVRIPEKNMKNFLGYPLIEYTFKFFNNINFNFVNSKYYCVSDFKEIETLTRIYNLVKYIDETKLKAKTFNEKIKEVFKNEKIKLTDNDIIILCQPTSPLRNDSIIGTQLLDFVDSKYDVGFSVYPL